MNRTKPSHIPLFPDAYLRDNYRLTLEQHGIYLLLIMEAWNQPDCTLPDDEEALAAITQLSVARFRKVAPPVLAKWTREHGRIYQKRLRKEWSYVQHKRELARSAVQVREQRRDIGRSSDDASDDHRATNTLGGGGGVGGESQFQEEEVTRGYTHARGLTVIGGGGK